MICNQNGIVGGLGFAKETFKLIDKKLSLIFIKKRGFKNK